MPVGDRAGERARVASSRPSPTRLRAVSLRPPPSEAALQVVEDEARRRPRGRSATIACAAVADDEDAPPASVGVELGRRGPGRSRKRCGARRAAPAPRARGRSARASGTPTEPARLAALVDDRGRLDLRRDLDEIGESGCRVHRVRRYQGADLRTRADPSPPARAQVLRRPRHPPRGDGRVLRAALVRAARLPRALAPRPRAPRRRVELLRQGAEAARSPGRSLESIITLVRRVQNNAAALGIIGGVGLLWSSLSLFSALESAFNIVYGRPNRSLPAREGDRRGADGRASLDHALRQPRGRRVRRRACSSATRRLRGQRRRRLHRSRSAPRSLGVFVFLLVVYYWLPNTDVSWREALPGAIARAIVLEASFQALPIFVRLAERQPRRCGRSAGRRSSCSGST